MRRLAYAGACLAVLDHYLALRSTMPGLALGLFVPVLVAAAGLQAVAVIRYGRRGYSVYTLIGAVPPRGKAVLAAALAYSFYQLWRSLPAAAAGDAAPWAVIGSSVALYMFLFSAEVLGLELHDGDRTGPAPEHAGRPTADAAFEGLPRVRMARRIWIVPIVTGVGFLATASWALGRGDWLSIAAPFSWVLIGNLLAYTLLRCPHCGKMATRSPSGWTSWRVGQACRWCGQAY